MARHGELFKKLFRKTGEFVVGKTPPDTLADLARARKADLLRKEVVRTRDLPDFRRNVRARKLAKRFLFNEK